MIPDHLNLPVNDLTASARFYQDPAGWISEGQDGPFTIMRVAPDFIIQLAPWGRTVGGHLACAMSRAEFDPAFQRFRDPNKHLLKLRHYPG